MICKECKQDKDKGEYYESLRNNKIYLNPRCKDCCRTINRERAKQSDYKEKRKERYQRLIKSEDFVERRKSQSRKHYKSHHGRAASLLKTANRRSSKFAEDCNLDVEFIVEKLKNGKCEVTGIPFEYENKYGTSKNPLAPSIDRIDSNKGYVKDNVRLVIWQFNLMKGELTDDQVNDIFLNYFNSLK